MRLACRPTQPAIHLGHLKGTLMKLTLDQLTVAELRYLCRQHGIPESFNAQQMRDALTSRQAD